MLEDQQIIGLLFAREEQGIQELAEKYGGLCRQISGNILNNDQDAEECVNDTWLAAWNTIPPQRPNPLKTYILRILRNISIARYHANTALKRNSYYDTALEELENCLESPLTVEAELDARELAAQINRFLEKLDGESRMLFVRRYWYADGISALALRFRTNSNNISVRLSRIREKLRKFLEKEGYIL